MQKKTAEAVLCKRKLSVLLLGYLYKRNPVMLVQIRAVSRNDRLTYSWMARPHSQFWPPVPKSGCGATENHARYRNHPESHSLFLIPPRRASAGGYPKALFRHEGL